MAKKKSNYDYEAKIEDVEEIVGTDIKINPDFYIHNAILKAQSALVNEDVKAGFLQFRILVENIEIMCRAANMMTNEYTEQIDQFVGSTEYQEKSTEIKQVSLANKKMELLLKEVFSAKVSTTPMRIK